MPNRNGKLAAAKHAFKESEYFEVYKRKDGVIMVKKKEVKSEEIKNRFEILDL